ncbi:hypothetical protein [uncultured Porphyromonas sp.]|uniref:hypothetical protein n=1 Tax=uncultured Porphyromonas sp. TaxID=159274 RepID=UPI0025F49978|nr:hypothetical protein [uncultured Porphyromonas sp.]
MEWRKRVSGLSNGSVGIAGSLSGLSELAEGLLLDKDKVTVGNDFVALARKLEDGSYTEANWSQSAEWSRIKAAVEAGRVYRQGRDAQLTAVDKKASDTATLAGQLSGRLTTAEGSLTTLKSEAKQTANLASSLQTEVNSLKGGSLKLADFEKFKSEDFKQLTNRVSAKASELATLTTLVKNEQSTWTDAGVPSPLAGESESSIKARTMPWGKGGDPSVHIGDTYIVTGTGGDRGKMYRFVRNSSGQYYWEKVADNDGTLALSKVAEEQTARKEALTNMQTALTGEMKTLRKDLKQEATNRQSAITSAVQASESKMSNSFLSKISEQVKTLYTVNTFQEGTLISGRISSPAHDSSGGAVIRHTAVVRNLAGTDVTQSKGSGLQWKVNKGRTSAPQERIVTGAQCDVSESDLVKEAGAPAYYDIELYREF